MRRDSGSTPRIGARWLRILGLGAVLTGLAPGGVAMGASHEERVSMNHFVFTPEELTVPAGTTVTWTYDDDPDDPQPNCEWPPFRLTEACPGHSTTARDQGPDGAPLWDSGVHRAEGFPFSHTFDTPGRYAYYCSIHGGDEPNNPLTAMNGVIVVTAAEGEQAAEPVPEQTDGAGAGAALPRTGGPLPGALGLGLLALAALVRRVRTGSAGAR